MNLELDVYFVQIEKHDNNSLVDLDLQGKRYGEFLFKQ